MEADKKSFTRLHITPLDPDLLEVVIQPSVLPRASNISYHTIECFPEKRYGFVDLPPEDAEKIKRKLNGAVLKGVKIRIEQARPDDMPRPTATTDEADASSKKQSLSRRVKESKLPKDKNGKRKREVEEIPGVELDEGRKVKRGWTVTEPSSSKTAKKERKGKGKEGVKGKDRKTEKTVRKKKEIRSRYTDGPECLMKTAVPASATEAADGSKKRKSKSGMTTVVVHEFEKTTKFPTFLKGSNSAGSSKSGSSHQEFVDGVGWVDEDGNVVEPVRSSRRGAAISVESKAKVASPSLQVESSHGSDTSDSDTSSSGLSSDDDDCDDRGEEEEKEEELNVETPEPKAKPQPTPISIPINQSSTPATQSRKDGGSLSATGITPATDSPRPKSASSVRSLTIKIPTAPSPATPAAVTKKVVHPLEALYKRPKPVGDATPSQEEQQQQSAAMQPPSFSFFDAVPENSDEEAEADLAPTSQPPMTPFTRQDMEFRNIRSAAPTPDTAFHNRSFRFWPRTDDKHGNGGGDEDEEMGEDGPDDEHGGDDDGDGDEGRPRACAASLPQPDGEQQSGEATSDFQKWFWENRGDLNRSWKKRRKLASKEKRYRDNKSRRSRAV